MMSRQDFVDNLGAQGDGLINDNIASCMYDGLSEDPEAASAVQEWEDGDAGPPELDGPGHRVPQDRRTPRA